MSEHFRCGGGGGMQIVGYESAQLPAGGGGGAGTLPQLDAVKATTGWSSRPFGAAPDWPFTCSKKPTPVIVPVPLSLRDELVGAPHAATSAARARLIFARAFGVAPVVQDELGNAAIIVPPVRGSAITRLMSRSSSSCISTSLPMTRNVVRSMPRLRRRPSRRGGRARRSARIVVVFGLRRSARPAGSASVFTGQRSPPHPICFAPGAVVFAGARPTQAKGTIARPRKAAASAVRLEIRTLCPLWTCLSAAEIALLGQLSGAEAYSTGAMEGSTRETDFVALGQRGSEAFAGIETFPNPGVSHVEMTSDELTAVCPVTGQPDLYVATIEYWPGRLCIESKSLQLYLNAYRDQGAFAEALAVKIRDDAAEALQLAADKVRVTLRQKARGGITITATT